MVADAASGHDPQGVEALVVLVQVAEGQGGLALPEEHLRPLGLREEDVWRSGAAGSEGGGSEGGGVRGRREARHAASREAGTQPDGEARGPASPSPKAVSLKGPRGTAANAGSPGDVFG